MIVIIDNYDSFTYNLVHVIGDADKENKHTSVVVRNDEMTVDEIIKLNPTHLIISPGPGYPKDAGISKDAILEFYKKIPVLGVCLGHQAICEVFGSRIVHAKQLMHGKQSELRIDTKEKLFLNLNEKIKAARYHSLIAEEKMPSKELQIIAKDCENNEVMAVKHRDYPLYGVQFHPESILTPDGEQILSNFINLV